MIGRIQIRTTMGQIGIRTEKANIEIENSLPKMTIRRKQAEFRINPSLPSSSWTKANTLLLLVI